ncbi:GNAT family N-acetyltransferase [Brevundimonas diminuta]|uniref:GNAT family N-acetyltransferase n=1 Tax=Brevundimonas diminuta TaxID=293 RepID=UPI0020980E60|nr:GNAT family N-acetyltransferase [Brevundimonas diminuta]MCO8019906.1 GNAT family N-acetyltransferase [Brevundimonas diminuta]MCO8023337.1 GNAT family N-acetyltransferase [Brevundimonas diminuta]
MTHPLDRPVWSALTSERQAPLAVGAGGALRLAPGYGVFAASIDQSPPGVAAIAALDQPEGMLATVEADPTPVPPGLTVLKEAVLSQMVLVELAPAKVRDIAVEPLTEVDAPAMLALATLTEPGPFFERTHRLGDFFGVKQDGRLLAMAGERLKPDGFTEVSGVCAHPDARGRGYAGALMRAVIERILARGETAFLHSYADNVGAIALYHSLGFTIRAPMQMRMLTRGDLAQGQPGA